MAVSKVIAEDLGETTSRRAQREVLPGNVVPRHYHLTLEPDFDKLTFDGTVRIELDVAEDSRSIILNAFELDIHSAVIASDNEILSTQPDITQDEVAQTCKFAFTSALAKGCRGYIEIKFTGQLNDNMAGFYRSTYEKQDGSQGILAISQMEATEARKALPCFDEPALKAKFTVTLIADQNFTCLSNMDVASQSVLEGGRKAVRFSPSPVMSTYLLSFVVGDLDFIESREFRVPVRVYAPRGQNMEEARFSLDLAAKTLAFYEKLFDIEYSLPKLDQVAVPDAQDAMENWGLIIYRNADLLFDPETSGASYRQYVTEMVQHELAHQWFGNLVTMDWWDGLWLNEGFATWISWYASNAFFPDWHVWRTFVVSNSQSAMALDSLRSSHPVEVTVNRADEINQIFDAISYEKGSCVLRMISTHIGEDVFLQGVQQYLKRHTYGSTKTSDLWAALSEVSGEPLEETMATWTKAIGFPILTVTAEGPDKIRVQQNRFLQTGDVAPNEDETIYPVYLNIRTHDGVETELTLRERAKIFNISSNSFFKLNANHTGLYRTLYTVDHLKRLAEAARDGLLSVEDRAGMIADAGALATPGYQKTSSVLTFLKEFSTESEYVVWSEIIQRTVAIQNAWMFEDRPVRDGLQSFLRELVSSKAHELGWDISSKDGHIQQQYKALLFETAGLSGDEKTVEAARGMFARFVSGDAAAIQSNLRRSVFAIVLKYGGNKEYDDLMDIYRAATSDDERNTVLRALGRAADPNLVRRTLGLLFSGQVKDQDVYIIVGGLWTHPGGAEAAFTWLTDNWDEMYKRLPPTLPMFSTVITLMTSGFTTVAQLERVERFFAGQNTTSIDQVLAQSVDAIKSKISWVERDRSDVRSWLQANSFLS